MPLLSIICPTRFPVSLLFIKIRISRFLVFDANIRFLHLRSSHTNCKPFRARRPSPGPWGLGLRNSDVGVWGLALGLGLEFGLRLRAGGSGSCMMQFEKCEYFMCSKHILQRALFYVLGAI